MDTITTKLESGKTYHLFNRGNNRGNLFFRPDNYAYFLTRYNAHLSPVVDTLAYCLMPNHFHLLIRVKGVEEIGRLSKSPRLGKSLNATPDAIVSEKFRVFFMAYSKAINKQQKREGSLFRKYFRRKLITDETYLLNTLYYIHHNPVHHGFTDILTDYPWTSYGAYLSDEPSIIRHDIAMSFFSNTTDFVDFHRRPPENLSMEEMEID